jgi:ABC-2 type transport system ATP-binding protein
MKLDDRKVTGFAEQLDFAPDRLDSRVGGYSKGMVQKLGLLSCLMLERRLVILDEPLSGLDPRARYHFKELMNSMKSSEHTVLYSTHLLADAGELCDRFGILHGGEMKYQGTPADCLRRYHADTLEKAYMNCIEDHVVSGP